MTSLIQVHRRTGDNGIPCLASPQMSTVTLLDNKDVPRAGGDQAAMGRGGQREERGHLEAQAEGSRSWFD